MFLITKSACFTSWWVYWIDYYENLALSFVNLFQEIPILWEIWYQIYSIIFYKWFFTNLFSEFFWNLSLSYIIFLIFITIILFFLIDLIFYYFWKYLWKKLFFKNLKINNVKFFYLFFRFLPFIWSFWVLFWAILSKNFDNKKDLKIIFIWNILHIFANLSFFYYVNLACSKFFDYWK